MRISERARGTTCQIHALLGVTQGGLERHHNEVIRKGIGICRKNKSVSKRTSAHDAPLNRERYARFMLSDVVKTPT